MDKKKREVGGHYVMAYTRPVYDRSAKQYLPDNFRFTDPIIRRVSYGGLFKDAKRFCAICGRKGQCYSFLDLDTFREFYVSQHCLMHDSTTLWAEDTSEDTIKQWYEREDITRRAAGGDPLAGLTLALEDLEARDEY